ncbi:DUF3331 domain-containing protein [Burkholderia lata]|uniref:DUF3331 domain-containing protein n=1 Tax=Burkholderia lata (strain ATCC 17760 / DSM 23089 / LMG 22485 / NCIMB 9086 / R18194 / 383) TaxID=482957 RepID=UPI001582EF11|nr:DUF3331 domain-containing protein [Burkholderia lata]
MVLRKRTVNDSTHYGFVPEISVQSSGARGNVIVEIVDKESNRIYLRWAEPGRCHYGEQAWALRCANRVGVCAYSGFKIEIGDVVYMPIGRPRPLNAREMILMEKISGAIMRLIK